MKKNPIESQAASIGPGMTASARRVGFALALSGGLAVAGSALAAPCFVVDGTKVTVNQLFASDPKAHVVDVEDMPSVSTMASRGAEARNMIFMGIKRDAARKNVTAFSARIDDKGYEFPKDACAGK